MASTKQKRSSNTHSNLKTVLYRMLKDNGELDCLKSQIRHRMILELNERKQSKTHIKWPGSAVATDEPEIFRELVDCLFMDHLQTNEYLYTLSVFLPECGLTNHKMLSPIEMLRILKLPNESELINDLNRLWTGKFSFVCRLLACLTAYRQRSFENKDVQTELNCFPGMDARINHIDHEYQLRRQLALQSSKASIEERVEAYRNEVAQEAKLELQRQMNEFRQLELVQLRMKVEQESQEAWKERRQQLEEEFRSRLSNLSEREQQIQERIVSMTKTEEREAFLRRQQLQTELESVHNQTVHLKEEKEHLNRERKRWLEEQNQREHEFQARERKLLEREQMFEIKVTQEVERQRFEEQLRLSQQKKELELLKIQLEESSKTMESEKQMVQCIKTELMAQKQKFSEMELVEYELLKEQKETLKKDIELLKGQLKNAYKEIESHKEAITTAQLQLGTISSAKQEIDQLRTYLNNERASFSLEKRQLQGQIDEQVKENRALVERLTRSEKEVVHLRKTLTDVCTAHRKRSLATGVMSSSNTYRGMEVFPVTDSEISGQNSPLNLKTRPPVHRSKTPPATQGDYWAKQLEEARQRMANLQCESERLESVYERWRVSKWGEASTVEPQETYGIYSTPLTGPTSSISWRSQLPIRSTLSGSLLPTSYVQESSAEKPSKSSTDALEKEEKEPSEKPSRATGPPERDTSIPAMKESSTNSVEPTGPVSRSPTKSLLNIEIRDSVTTTQSPVQTTPCRVFPGNGPHVTEQLTSISSPNSVKVTRCPESDISPFIVTPQSSTYPKPTSTPDIRCAELRAHMAEKECAPSPSSSESSSESTTEDEGDKEKAMNGYRLELNGGQHNGLNGNKDSCSPSNHSPIHNGNHKLAEAVGKDNEGNSIGLLEKYLNTTQNAEANSRAVPKLEPERQQTPKRERTFNQFMKDTESISSDSDGCLTAAEESENSSNRHGALSTGRQESDGKDGSSDIW